MRHGFYYLIVKVDLIEQSGNLCGSPNWGVGGWEEYNIIVILSFSIKMLGAVLK